MFDDGRVHLRRGGAMYARVPRARVWGIHVCCLQRCVYGAYTSVACNGACRLASLLAYVRTWNICIFEYMHINACVLPKYTRTILVHQLTYHACACNMDYGCVTCISTVLYCSTVAQNVLICLHQRPRSTVW